MVPTMSHRGWILLDRFNKLPGAPTPARQG
jgi:hypothetical protein